MRLEVSSSLEHLQEHQHLQEQAPFQLVHGIEVLENVQERGYKSSRERSHSVESSYRDFRDSVLLSPPFDKAAVISTLGATGSGKSSVNQGLYRVATSDQYLQHSLREAGVSLDVVSVPFSLYAEAAKTQAVHREKPDYAIDPNRMHGEYTADEYHRISALMQHDMEEVLYAQEGTGRATLVLLEPSAPTAVPDPENPHIARGIDRGLTPLYVAATDPVMQSRVDVYALTSDDDVRADTIAFRQKIQEGVEQDIFRDDITVVYTDYDELTEGEDLEVSTLSVRTQEKVRKFLARSAAPPSAKLRSDQKLMELKQQLKDNGYMGSTTDRRYFRLIQDRLSLPDRRFHYIDNAHLLGRKTYDLDYFIHSLPVRIYPEIMNQ